MLSASKYLQTSRPFIVLDGVPLVMLMELASRMQLGKSIIRCAIRAHFLIV